MAFNNRKQFPGFGAGKSKTPSTVAASAAPIVLPFGASLEDLETLHDKLKHLIKNDLVPKYFDDEVIRDMFFGNAELYTEKCNVSGLDLDGLMNIFNPIEENVHHAHWIGPDPIRQKKILCWFLGHTIPGEHWSDASRFTKANTDPSKRPVKIFDLADHIYICLKHRFNDAINRQEQNSAILTSHEFYNLDNGDLDFETLVSINNNRSEFSSENIDNTIAKINAKIAEENMSRERKYVAEQAAHAAQKKISIAIYAKKLSEFHDKLMRAASEVNFPVTPLDPVLIQIYAEFYYDAVNSGITRLEDKIISCSKYDIEHDMKLRMGIIVQIPYTVAHIVEKQMQQGKELNPDQAVKIASSNPAIGAGCM